jgi:chromosome segregation ATPase
MENRQSLLRQLAQTQASIKTYKSNITQGSKVIRDGEREIRTARRQIAELRKRAKRKEKIDLDEALQALANTERTLQALRVELDLQQAALEQAQERSISLSRQLNGLQLSMYFA